MPRSTQPWGAEALLTRVAATLARSGAPEQALHDFVATLQSQIPGLQARVFRVRGEQPALDGEWLSAPEAPPFPAHVGLDPRSATSAVLRSPGVIEISSADPDGLYLEAPYLRRAGGDWAILPITGPVTPGALVLHATDRAVFRDHLAEILAASGLIHPHLALIAAREEVERRIGSRTSELALFYETSRALAFARTVEDVAAVLAESLIPALRLELLGLMNLRSERGDLFVEAAGSASPGSLRGFRRAMTEEIDSVHGAKVGRLTVRIRRKRAARDRVRAGSGRTVHVALSDQGHVIGLLSVAFENEGVDESRLRLLYTVAGQAALTLERVRSVEQAEFLKIQTVLDSMSQGVILLDRRLRVELANPAARSLFADLTGRPLPRRLRKVGKVHTGALMDQVAAGAKPPPEEIEEADRFFQLTASPVHGLKGSLEGLLLVLSDVSRQRQLLDRLAQSEKLSSLGVMISGFAHELNNPLASIMGYAQLLAERDLVPDVQKKIAAINNEASRCHRIVDNLLRFARKQPSDRRSVDLNSVVGSVLQLMGYQLQSDGIIVDADLDRDMRPIVGDFHALQQVLVNIIHNAQQAMKGASRAGLLSIVTRCDGSTCSVEVSDNGPGISPDNLKRIFDPFFSTKKVGEGTGLGLSIAYGTINEHGGEIDVRSRVGAGTAFSIRIPAAPVAEATEASPEIEPRAEPLLAGKRILVVEDENSLAEMMCEALSAEGHQVDAATNGARAREMLLDAQYDLIISDMKMPSMGGREFYDVVLQMNPDLARKIIFSTGDIVSPETSAFFQKVGNPFLTKPFNLNDLFRIVHRALQHP